MYFYTVLVELLLLLGTFGVLGEPQSGRRSDTFRTEPEKQIIHHTWHDTELPSTSSNLTKNLQNSGPLSVGITENRVSEDVTEVHNYYQQKFENLGLQIKEEETSQSINLEHHAAMNMTTSNQIALSDQVNYVKSDVNKHHDKKFDDINNSPTRNNVPLMSPLKRAGLEDLCSVTYHTWCKLFLPGSVEANMTMSPIQAARQEEKMSRTKFNIYLKKGRDKYEGDFGLKKVITTTTTTTTTTTSSTSSLTTTKPMDNMSNQDRDRQPRVVSAESRMTEIRVPPPKGFLDKKKNRLEQSYRQMLFGEVSKRGSGRRLDSFSAANQQLTPDEHENRDANQESALDADMDVEEMRFFPRRPKRKNKRKKNKMVGVPGTAGRDYPTYTSIPMTSFSCVNSQAGFYADVETKCQVYHYCHFDGRQDSFLCSNGTIFNQKVFTCDWWYNVNCAASAESFNLNDNLYRDESKSLLEKLRDKFDISALESLLEVTTNRIGSQIDPEIREKARALKLFREKKQKLKSQINNDLKSLLLRDSEKEKTKKKSREYYDDYEYETKDYDDYYSEDFEKLLLQEKDKSSEEVSYESRPNGGFSVYYKLPEADISQDNEEIDIQKLIKEMNLDNFENNIDDYDLEDDYTEKLTSSNRGESKSDLLSLNKGSSKSKTDLLSLYLGDYYTDQGSDDQSYLQDAPDIIDDYYNPGPPSSYYDDYDYSDYIANARSDDSLSDSKARISSLANFLSPTQKKLAEITQSLNLGSSSHSGSSKSKKGRSSIRKIGKTYDFDLETLMASATEQIPQVTTYTPKTHRIYPTPTSFKDEKDGVQKNSGGGAKFSNILSGTKFEHFTEKAMPSIQDKMDYINKLRSLYATSNRKSDTTPRSKFDANLDRLLNIVDQRKQNKQDKDERKQRVIDLSDGANIKSINRSSNIIRQKNKNRFVDKESENSIKALSVMVQNNIDRSLNKNHNSLLQNLRLSPTTEKVDRNINLFDSIKISDYGSQADYNGQADYGGQNKGGQDRGDYGGQADYGGRDRGDYGGQDRGDYEGQADYGGQDRVDYGGRDRVDYGGQDRGDYGGQADYGGRDRVDYGGRDRGDYEYGGQDYYDYKDLSNNPEVSRSWFNQQGFQPVHKQTKGHPVHSSQARDMMPIVKPSFISGPFTQIEKPDSNSYTSSSLDLAGLLNRGEVTKKPTTGSMDSFFSQLNSRRLDNQRNSIRQKDTDRLFNAINNVDRSSSFAHLLGRNTGSLSNSGDTNSFIDLLGGDPASEEVAVNHVGSGFAQLINGQPMDMSSLMAGAAAAGGNGMRYTAGGAIKDPGSDAINRLLNPGGGFSGMLQPQSTARMGLVLDDDNSSEDWKTSSNGGNSVIYGSQTADDKSSGRVDSGRNYFNRVAAVPSTYNEGHNNVSPDMNINHYQGSPLNQAYAYGSGENNNANSHQNTLKMLADLQKNLDTMNKIYDGKVEAKGKIEFADFFGGGGSNSYGGGSGGINMDSTAFLPTVVPETSRVSNNMGSVYQQSSSYEQPFQPIIPQATANTNEKIVGNSCYRRLRTGVYAHIGPANECGKETSKTTANNNSRSNSEQFKMLINERKKNSESQSIWDTIKSIPLLNRIANKVGIQSISA